MKPARYLSIGTLVVSAIAILLAHRERMTHVFEALAVAIGFLVYLMVGPPWRWRERPVWPPVWAWAGAAIALLAMTKYSLGALLPLAWTFLLLTFQESFVENASRRLVLFTFLAFPWAAVDLEPIGTLLRYFEVAVMDWVLFALGLTVSHEGASLVVEGKPLVVGAAFSDLSVLQLLTINAFVILDFQVLRGSRFWCAVGAIPFLIFGVLGINALAMGTLSLSFGPDITTTWGHYWAGWATLCLTLIVCRGFFSWVATCSLKAEKSVRWE